MADNVTVDNVDLTDYSVVTDEITSPYTGGTHQAQAVKLLSGTANANDVIPGDATNGLDVDVTRVQGTVTVGDGGSTLSVDDGGGSLTVDGTVAISAGSANIGDVDVLTVPAPLSTTGGGTEAAALRVTVASDSTGVLSVDDNGGSLTVDGTVTANLAAGTNNIGDVDVLSLPALPAGTNNIGDVDVLSVVPGTGATALGKAEDAAHASGDTGVMALAVRNDAGTAFAADGDYVPLSVDSAGAVRVTGGGGGTQYTEGDTDASVTGTAVLWEDTSDTLRVASAAKPLPVNIVAGGGSGGTAMTDDAAFTPATTSFTPVGGTFDNVAPDSVDEGDGGAFRMSANRSLYVNIRDNAGNERGLNIDAAGAIAVTDGGGALTVDGTVTTSPSGDHTVIGKAADGAAVSGNPVLIAGQDGTNVQSLKTDAAGELQVDVLTLPALAAGTNNIGDVDVLTVPAPLSTAGGGTEATALRVTLANDSTGLVSVDDNGGSLTVDGTVTVTDGLNVEGDVAHDGVDAGNPIKVGAKAVAHGTNPTAVAAADRTHLYANRHGIQWTIGGHPNAKSATYITTAAGTDDNVMAAIAGGTKYAVTRITITLDEATTVGVGVRLGFGATTVPALGASQADAVDDILVYHPGLVPGGGITIGDGSGVLGVGGDGAELRITNEVPTSGTLAVTVTYFTIES